MNKFKKYISILLIVVMLSVQNITFVIAQETQESTPTPEAQSSETSSTTENTQPDPTPTTDVVSPTPIETQSEGYNKEDQEDLEDDDLAEDAAEEAERDARKAQWLADREVRRQAQRDAEAAAIAAAASATPTPATNGDTEIETGDATSTAVVNNDANNNIAGATIGSGAGGATIANTGNGSDSTNNGSAVIGNSNETTQNNSATVNTNLHQSSVTGGNEASGNTGGNSSIETGDANVSGTVVTTVNTNAAGVMVSEFNVADDHVGDLVLDFAANCVSGCGSSVLSAENTGNGTGSTNDSNVESVNDNVTFQNNDAVVGNNLVLSADSGNNVTSKNTGGDSDIKTGDANVSANVLTLANNNIAGNVIYGVVNIFGNLIGDILLTEEMMNACCGGSLAAQNTGNGSDSTNNADLALSNSDSTFQNNDASITNNLILDTETGDNDASQNTGGDSSIETGDTNIQANILNIANSNILGGNMWLVIVNEAGRWVGKIMGAPAGQTFAGADGSEFMVDENGYITAAINEGNGSDSTNNAGVSQSNTNSTTQNNTANIENTLDLSANTGGNTASKNTGGSQDISTGDATIVANLVNFVNNNIAGNGKLFVTVINVFGSWMGDFVAPGQVQDSESNVAEAGRGGSNEMSNNSGSNTESSNNNSSNSTTTVKKSPLAIIAAVLGDSDEKTDSVLGSTVSGQGDGSSKVKTAMVKNATYSEASDEAVSGTTINLAWILLLAPLAVIAIFGKKYIYRKVLPQLSK